MSERNTHFPVWLPLAVGTALSVGLGALFYFRTDLKTAIAVFAGLLGVAIALQLELLLQVRHAASARQRRELLATRIEDIHWLPPLVDGSLAALESIRDAGRSPMAMTLARVELESCLERLRDLQRGFVREQQTWDGDQVDALTTHLRDRLRATSGPQELSWWRTSKANYYLQQQTLAIQRGVVVERIFIYDTWSDLYEEVCNRQQSLGIKVYRVDARRILDVRYPDLVLWDDMCGLSVDFNLAGTSAESRFTFVPSEIRKLGSIFDTIRATAEEFSPATT